jgi:phi13 family phage major tail protein
MANKVKFGLKNVYYAVVTESNGVVSYGTPKSIPGAVTLTQNATGEAVTFYADDSEYYSKDTNNGYDGNLEVALIPDQFKIDVFGETLDANGVLVENKDAVVKRIALMFEFDGDANKTRYVNYNVKVSRPSIESGTHTNTKEVKTDSMAIEVRPAVDTGDVKAKVEYGTTPYSTFFTAVYVKNAAVNTTSAAAITFSKATSVDKAIDNTSTDVTNTVKNVMVDGLNVPGVSLTVTGVNVSIDDVYLKTLTNGLHTLVVEFEKGNAVTIALTITA